MVASHNETLAIIDLGTNTFHLIIVDLKDRELFSIKEKYKENVRLGEGGITTGYIAPAAFDRGLLALKKFRAIIDSKYIQRVFAIATSALRGASNAAAFVQEAKTQAGIDIRIINGNEEASLIYQGVRRGVPLGVDDYSLLVDIGGGSVEFIVANRHHSLLLRSLNIGAARMLETIATDDPPTEAQLTAVRAHYQEALAVLVTELREFKISRIVGSSGTFETLGSIIGMDAGQRPQVEMLNGFTFNAKAFKKAHRKIVGSNRKTRLTIEGMDPVRVDMILMGSILVDYLLEELKLDQVVVSTYALKEGILFNYLEEREAKLSAPQASARVLRLQAIRALGEKYQFNRIHVEQVGRLALSLFDQTASLHSLGAVHREMLEYAAYLHDIGHFINHSGHHKHGQYVIINSNLPGFSSDELLLMGNIVRYHRKSLPSSEHLHYNLLYREDKQIVRQLAGILRIADNLDRAKRGLVKHVELQTEGSRAQLLVFAESSVDLEIEATQQQRELFELAFNCSLQIRQALPVKAG